MTMKSVDPAHLRSVVLAGHAGGGKTTLAEQLLFRAGAIPRLGRVDDGTAHLDFEPEEQKRKRVAEPRGRDVRARRRPGSRSSTRPATRTSSPRSSSGFAAADGALFVVDASAGVEAGLETAVALGRSTGRAACFFLNKCDRENADPTAALDALRERLRQQDRAAPPGDRQGRVVQRLRRPRPPQGVRARGRQGGRDPGPGRARRRDRDAAATSCSRPPPRPTTT